MTTTKAPALLKAWMDENRWNASTFSAAYGYDAKTVQFWLRGKAKPHKSTRARLDEITRGAVPASAWGNGGVQDD